MEQSARVVFEIGLVLLLAVAAGWGARRVGLPAVIGYLAVGLLVSPFTPGYVADRHQLQVFADIGVVLLLFEVGIEIDPLKLGASQRPLLWSVPIHTIAVSGIAAAGGVIAGLGWQGASLLGVAVALSSGVVVVNITRSARRTSNAVTEDALLGWSVVQDVTGVAIAAAILAAIGVNDRPWWLAIASIVAFAALTVVAAWVVPRVLSGLTNQPDLFLTFSVACGLTLAAIGDRVFGLPLALAAFLAGLAISEGPTTATARERLLPFRDVFAVLFFVAVGSLIDPSGIPSALGWVIFVLALVLVVKAGSIYGLARLLRMPQVSPYQLSVGLGQIGEFSFVLASIGAAEGLIPPQVYTAILCAVVVTIAISTVAVRHRPVEVA